MAMLSSPEALFNGEGSRNGAGGDWEASAPGRVEPGPAVGCEALFTGESERVRLCARVLHGSHEGGDFLHLAHQHKRIAWVMGDDAVSWIFGSRGRTLDRLWALLGFESAWVEDVVRSGRSFKLAVFPAASLRHQPLLATWDGLLAALRLHYPPSVASAVKRWRHTLPAARLDDVLAQHGCSFAASRDVCLAGPSHPLYMTSERLVASRQTLADVRSFLYYEVGCARLYSGTGYAVMPDGSRGFAEFLAPNGPLATIANCNLLDIPHDLQWGNDVVDALAAHYQGDNGGRGAPCLLRPAV